MLEGAYGKNVWPVNIWLPTRWTSGLTQKNPALAGQCFAIMPDGLYGSIPVIRMNRLVIVLVNVESVGCHKLRVRS